MQSVLLLCLRRACLDTFNAFLLSTHADGQGVDISVTVCVCVFVQLQIFPPTIKLRRQILHIRTAANRRPRQGISHLGELCSTKAQNRTKRPARGPRQPRCKRYRTDAPT